MFLRPRSWLSQPIIDLYDASRLDVVTAWRRLWQRPYKLPTPDYLQVGSGDSRLPGFLNTDHFVNKNAEFPVDIRYPLPFASDRWQGIFAHHIVEHVTYAQAKAFFAECLRILKAGGTLRIVVPDVEKFVRLYAAPEHERLGKLRALLPHRAPDEVDPPTAMGYVGYAVYCNRYNVHRSSWDFETLMAALRGVGFAAVTRAECGVSRDPHMRGIDKPHWADHSLYVEAVK
ncbi:MAG TPA: methyltransferase domain-containing protein [Bradyrhizobium sp.]|nr:methyltransferase domain-containing protein [Bradyrhizobium sp.]